MNRLDKLSLDGRLLSLFVAVHETGSVTNAALSMNVTQSNVSHGLNRLRDITGDALFVPMGRGIVPTDRADELVEDARRILRDLEQFAQVSTFNPQTNMRPFVIAASDYEIEIIGKPLIARLRLHAPNTQIYILRALEQSEWAGLLRSGSVDLVLSPELTTQEQDIKQQRILSDDVDVCYFDANYRSSPDSLDTYCEAHHVIMSAGRFQKTRTDRILFDLGRTRHIAVSMPSFSAVATILTGTEMVALMPKRLEATTFATLTSCDPPFQVPGDTISQIWHTRSDASPRHAWLRAQTRAAVRD